MKIPLQTLTLQYTVGRWFHLSGRLENLPPSTLIPAHLENCPPQFPPDETVKTAIRDMMREGGFKPAGRSKPASEYLLKAAAGGFLSGINPIVDACNVVSYHSGIPISVVDTEKIKGSPFIGTCPSDSEVVFNASGQRIRMDGLAALHDESGPCACGVKDSHRTKTSGQTQQVIAVFWGCRSLMTRTENAAKWFTELVSPWTAESGEVFWREP